MQVFGEYIKNRRLKNGLDRCDLAAGVCTEEELKELEENNYGRLKLILLLCKRLDISYQSVFPEKVLQTPKELLAIVETLSFRNEYQAAWELLDKYSRGAILDDPGLAGKLLYFKGYTILNAKGDLKEAIYYFQRTLTLTHEESTYELLALKGLAHCYKENNEEKRAKLFYEQALRLKKLFPSNPKMVPLYYNSEQFLAEGQQGKEKARRLCDEGIQILKKGNKTEGLDRLYYEKATHLTNKKENKIDFLKKAAYYAKVNQNYYLEDLIEDKQE